MADRIRIDALIAEGRSTIREVMAAAASAGVSLSKSAVGRYMQAYNAGVPTGPDGTVRRAQALRDLAVYSPSGEPAFKPRVRVRALGVPRLRIRVKAGSAPVMAA